METTPDNQRDCMSILEDDRADFHLPAKAVKALTAASKRARRAGYWLVVVEDGALVRKGPGGKKILKVLPARPKVSIRSKRAQQQGDS